MPKDTQKVEFTFDLQKLVAELAKCHKKKQASGEASSALGQLRKQAAEGLGCHKDAFSIIERIDGMSEDKLADFIRSFAPMYEAMIETWQARITDMVDKAEKQSADMESEMG